MARHLACLFVACLFIKGYSCSIRVQNIEAKEGEEVIIKCQSDTQSPIVSCGIKLPDRATEELADEYLDENILTIKPVNQAKNLPVGICEGKLKISEKFNGISICSLRLRGGSKYQTANFNITVLREPRSLELYYDSSRKGQLDAVDGQKVNFTCKSVGGRPASKLQWFIGTEPIRSGLSRELIEDLPGDLHTVSQNLTFLVQKAHHKKAVRCSATHPAWKTEQKPMEIDINVLFPPKSSEFDPLRVYGLIEGQETTLMITIEGNPSPRCLWSVNGTTVHGNKYSPGIRAIGGDKYNVTLRIASVEKSDDHDRIALNCTNVASRTGYIHNFQISTKEGPPDFAPGLGINAILGIVVGVLIILLIALLLVYARLKGRWCFAGKTAAQTGGRESSDTESAEQQQKAKRTNKEKLNFKAFFRKSPTSNPKETEKSSDPLNPKPEKTDDAIVYAELDLKPSSTQPTKQPTQAHEDKTEYAEIVATKKSLNK